MIYDLTDTDRETILTALRRFESLAFATEWPDRINAVRAALMIPDRPDPDRRTGEPGRRSTDRPTPLRCCKVCATEYPADREPVSCPECGSAAWYAGRGMSWGSTDRPTDAVAALDAEIAAEQEADRIRPYERF
jgi:hypothetical protein